ncbi:MAG: phytoene/squalene synthase family protein [Paludibacter sp.]|nr:phytoene/squalene synthase family protein [Paludibacter sp.]
MDIYSKTTFTASRFITKSYSTSFYISTRLLERDVQQAIFGIYGFVRFADEIVDTFHDYDKAKLLSSFESDLKMAINQKISMNPVLHAFQLVIHQYKIPYELIDAFMRSMKADLNKQVYQTREETDEYIYGSANVVGLMCLKVFTRGDETAYNRLKVPAMKLGSAFQKVNFLRDLNTDINELQRQYFSNYMLDEFNDEAKCAIINEIKQEFNEAYLGIKQLPGRSKLAVLTAYFYYMALLRKIEGTPSCHIMQVRVRVSDFKKTLLLVKAMFMYKLRMI